MHLADAFIQSDLHCIQVTVSTFYQLLLSLGIEPMILAYHNTFLWDEIWPSSPKGATENMTTAEQEIQNCIGLWFNEIQNDLQQINQVVLIEAKLHRSLQYLIVIWQSQQIFL